MLVTCVAWILFLCIFFRNWIRSSVKYEFVRMHSKLIAYGHFEWKLFLTIFRRISCALFFSLFFFFFVLVRSQNHLLNIFPNYFGWECICRHSNWPPFELSTTVVVNVSPKGLLWQWTIFKQIKINTILTPIMPINIGHSLAYLWRW